MTCPICNGSGERDGEYGLLSCDAPNCTGATERAALEAANKAAEPMTVYDQRWFAYCAGAKAGLEKAAKYRTALEQIYKIQDMPNGSDWQEIEEAREIAIKAIIS